MWRTMMPAGSAVVACDGADVVGMAAYLDLKLTVPGGAVLPMAGVSWVAVSPTHRRRGVLTAMFAELHGRMGDYPIAGLEASEAGIYGRFGYGPATVEHRADRRPAGGHGSTPTSPTPAASGSSRPQSTANSSRTSTSGGGCRHRAACTARASCGTTCSPTVRTSGMAAARSSVCCTPTASRCTGRTGTTRRRGSRSPSWPR